MKNYTKSLMTVICFLFSVTVLSAQSLPYQWITAGSGANDDYVYDMTVDADGYVYTTGKFKGMPLDFGNGVTLTANNSYDIYVAKFDPAGQVVWAKKAGGMVSNEGRGIMTDADKNVIVTGGFYGTGVFGTDTLISVNNFDVFFAKYSPDGDIIWLQTANGYNQLKGTNAILANDGNYIFTGYFGGSSTDTMNIAGTTVTGNGNRDIYIAKLNATDGSLMWVTTAGSDQSGEEPWGLTQDDENNIYVSGTFAGTATFGSTTLTSASDRNIFYTKLDASGNFVWAKSLECTNRAYTYNLCYNNSRQEFMLAGTFKDTMNIGAMMLVSNGGYDILGYNFDKDGSFVGVGYFGGPADDYGYGVASYNDSVYYAAGKFKESMVIYGDTLTSAGGSDLFITEITNGAITWIKQAGGTSDDNVRALAMGEGKSVYVGGYFKNTIDFDGSSFTAADTRKEFFIAKLAEDNVPVELVSFSAAVVDENVNLTWKTATETNNSGFEVQKSIDKTSFTKVGFINGNGTTTSAKAYNFTDDNNTNGTVYYRLKQIDFDGTYSYSNTIEVNLSSPITFKLDQNYPNPFNPSTQINFSIPVDAKVRLTLFNMLGQEVMTLVNDNISAGVHTVKMNGSNLSSGTYFYRVEAKGLNGQNFVNTKKMILLK